MGYRDTNKIQLLGAQTVYDPVDSTTYYFGLLGGSAPSTADIYPIPIGVKGTIRTVVLRIAVGTNGTAEDTIMYIRKNGTTDYTVFSVVEYNSSPQTKTATDLEIPVDVGDYISVKFTTPAWATNPLQVRQTIAIVIEQ